MQVKKDKKRGTYYFVLELGKDPITDKRKQYKRSGFKRKGDAEDAMARAREEHNQGVLIKPSEMMYGDFIENEWFRWKKASLSPQTQSTYEQYIHLYIQPYIGKVTLGKLESGNIRNLIATLSEKISTKTVGKILSVIRNSLDFAVQENMIRKNVAKLIDPPKHQKQEMKIWDGDEIKKFLNEAKNTRYYALFETALMTGMRMGELLGLKWEDIDLDNGLLRIRRTLSRDGKQILPPKTNSSYRTIKLRKSTVRALLEHQETSTHEFVFRKKNGNPEDPRYIRRVLVRIAEKAELEPIRFHDLRHSHASYLLSNGVNVKVIQERLGHRNIGVTLDTYSHLTEQMQDSAVAKLDELDD